jgi:hypothetical protein
VIGHTSISFGNESLPGGEAYHGFKVTITDGLPPEDEEHIRQSLLTILEKHDLKVTQMSNTHIIVST